jgi:predicted ATP-grasp superfamily ATP-dependent carboligase
MLAACRGLHLGGYRVVAAGRSRAAVALWSRYPAARALHPDPSADPGGFVDAVAAIAQRHRCSLVLPGTDPSLTVLSRQRDRLPGTVRLALPGDDAVGRALDKRLLLEAAGEAGFEVPESRVCKTSQDAAAAMAELGWPVLIKPVSSAHTTGGSVERRNTAIAFRPRDIPPGDIPVIVQRHLPGHVLSLGGVMHEGSLIAVAVSRYERTWPALAGAACFSETIAAPESLTGACAQLLNAIGWSGLFEIELVENCASPALIDLNPRPYGSMAVAIAAGANLPAILCDALTARAPDRAVVARSGVRYRWEDAELRHALRQLRAGRTRAAMRQLGPQRGVVHAHASAADPAPLAARAAQLALVAFRGRPARPPAAPPAPRRAARGSADTPPPPTG